ncbi:MAG: ABC-2 transporter permease [Candidatus Aminicenantes bacterium]|nr:ABC-2 transporter permease [Candidatus Aminicenantes bacterium]
MYRLMLKDLRLHKRFVVGFGIAYVIYMAIFHSRANNPGAVSIFGAFLYAIIPLLIFTREDKFKAAAFNLSLPVTRKEFLQARYVLGWLVMLVLYAGTSLLTIAVPGTKLGLSAIFQVKLVLLVIFFMAVVFGLLMPLVVAFGFAGMIVFLVFIQVLGIVSILLANLFQPAIRTAIQGMGAFLGSVQSGLGPVGSAIALLVALLLFSYGSFRLSLYLYQRKDV